MIDFKALTAPFPASEIQWRVGHTSDKSGKLMGLALAYYDCRALYDQLDKVCGPANWQIRYPHANGKTCAEIGIKIGDEWVWKANGAGDTDFEAEKGAFSDAAKRAGVAWGIGRYLYEMKDTWVECEAFGKTKVIKKSEHAKLNTAYERFVKTGVKPELKSEEAPKPLPVAEEEKPANAPPVSEEEYKMLLSAIKTAKDKPNLGLAGNKIKACGDRLDGPQQEELRHFYEVRLKELNQSRAA